MIADDQVKNSDEFLNFKILVKNLTSFTNYSIRIDLETYSLNSNSNRFESNLHILSSNVTNFKTKKSIKMYYSFILIGIGCFICLMALALTFFKSNLLKFIDSAFLKI